jgi:hypothetical protein
MNFLQKQKKENDTRTGTRNVPSRALPPFGRPLSLGKLEALKAKLRLRASPQETESELRCSKIGVFK